MINENEAVSNFKPRNEAVSPGNLENMSNFEDWCVNLVAYKKKYVKIRRLYSHFHAIDVASDSLILHMFILNCKAIFCKFGFTGKSYHEKSNFQVNPTNKCNQVHQMLFPIFCLVHIYTNSLPEKIQA